MDPRDWIMTSKDTNRGEAGHARAQREGIRLSLLAAVQRGMKVDQDFVNAEMAGLKFGVRGRYAKYSFIARKRLAIKRQKANATKKANRVRVSDIEEENEK